MPISGLISFNLFNSSTESITVNGTPFLLAYLTSLEFLYGFA